MVLMLSHWQVWPVSSFSLATRSRPQPILTAFLPNVSKCFTLTPEKKSRRRSLISFTDERGIFEEYRVLTKKYGHRSQQFADYVLPRSQTLVESIGHRLAYEAAVAEGVPQTLIDIYVCHVVNLHLGWYLESGLLTCARVVEMQNEAMTAAFPRMREWVDAMGVAPYIKAPILSDAAWKSFADGLYEFRPTQVADTNLSGLPEVRAML